MDKRVLTVDELNSLTAVELPERETPATVVMNCLAVCVGSITVSNVSVMIGAQVCAVANVLAGVLGRVAGGGTQTLTCNLSI